LEEKKLKKIVRILTLSKGILQIAAQILFKKFSINIITFIGLMSNISYQLYLGIKFNKNKFIQKMIIIVIVNIMQLLNIITPLIYPIVFSYG